MLINQQLNFNFVKHNKFKTTINKGNRSISRILIFYNNFRGLNLSKFLSLRGFEVFNIITRKFLNLI